MGIFDRLLGTRRPSIRRSDIPNLQKMNIVYTWFFKNDPLVKVLLAPGPNAIFDEGYRPRSDLYKPESEHEVTNLAQWFGIKMYMNMMSVKDMDKREFIAFLDFMDRMGAETLAASGELASTYDLDFEHFVYQNEIEKIPPGPKREAFKFNYLSDCVIGAEIRILAWAYHEFFGEWYQIRERRG